MNIRYQIGEGLLTAVKYAACPRLAPVPSRPREDQQVAVHRVEGPPPCLQARVQSSGFEALDVLAGHPQALGQVPLGETEFYAGGSQEFAGFKSRIASLKACRILTGSRGRGRMGTVYDTNAAFLAGQRRGQSDSRCPASLLLLRPTGTSEDRDARRAPARERPLPSSKFLSRRGP